MSDTQRLEHLIRHGLCLNNDAVPFAWYVMDMAGEAISSNFLGPRAAIDQSIEVIAATTEEEIAWTARAVDPGVFAEYLKWLTEEPDCCITAGVGYDTK